MTMVNRQKAFQMRPLALAHDVFVGRNDNHKDKQNWQQNTADDLGGHHDTKEAHASEQNNQCRNNQHG